MANFERISVEQARRDHDNGDALLICGYDSAEKCAEYGVPGAMPLPEFKAQADSLPKDRELIFYCA